MLTKKDIEKAIFKDGNDLDGWYVHHLVETEVFRVPAPNKEIARVIVRALRDRQRQIIDEQKRKAKQRADIIWRE